MSQVLVLVDHIDGAVRKTTLELLTIAQRLGEPAAVFIGKGFENAAGTLAEYGASVAYQIEGEGIEDYLVAPKAEALAAVVAQASPAAVLIPSSSEGKEIAARLAVKIDSGLITDASTWWPVTTGRSPRSRCSRPGSRSEPRSPMASRSSP